METKRRPVYLQSTGVGSLHQSPQNCKAWHTAKGTCWPTAGCTWWGAERSIPRAQLDVLNWAAKSAATRLGNKPVDNNRLKRGRRSLHWRRHSCLIPHPHLDDRLGPFHGWPIDNLLVNLEHLDCPRHVANRAQRTVLHHLRQGRTQLEGRTPRLGEVQ